MNCSLFLRILNAIEQYDVYFIQRNDALDIVVLFDLQMMTVVIRKLAYGMPADIVDEYVRIGELTTIESLKRLYVAIVAIYEEEYLRSLAEGTFADCCRRGRNVGFPECWLAWIVTPRIIWAQTIWVHIIRQ